MEEEGRVTLISGSVNKIQVMRANFEKYVTKDKKESKDLVQMVVKVNSTTRLIK